MATVHVEVFGPFGGMVRTTKVRLLTADRKRDLADQRTGNTISGVPYGQYMLVVSDTGGAASEQQLVVNAKEVWVRVGLPFPAGDRAWPGGDLAISGEISPAPTNQNEWWVRIEGVFLNLRRESPIGGTGHFSISGLEMGAYLVQVFEGAKLRQVETIEIDTNIPSTHLKISLSGPLCKGTAIERGRQTPGK